MKDLSKILLEKLKINKKTKIDYYDDLSALEKFFIMVGLDINDKDSYEIKSIKEKVEDWLEEEKIKEIEGYAIQKDLTDYGVPEKIQELFIVDDPSYSYRLKEIEDRGHDIFTNKNSHIHIVAMPHQLLFYDQSMMKSGFIFVNKYMYGSLG